MHDSKRHIFTNEFDDLRIVISLDMGITPSMHVSISEPDGVWDERVPISMDNPHYMVTLDKR